MIYTKYNLLIRSAIVIVISLVLIVFFKQGNSQVSVFNPDKELPIYSVEREDKKVAVTIDAAWGDEFTNDILETLDKFNVKATFFLVGFWVDEYPHNVEEIAKRGHEIGNHSTTHPDMSQISKESIVEELTITENKIKDIIGKRPVVFRPPYGGYNDLLIKTARELGYYTIQWDVDSLDWKELGVEPVIDRVMKNVGDGSIILFHNNAKYIKEYLPVIIERLLEKGYELVPVSELIYKDDFKMDNSGRQIYLK